MESRWTQASLDFRQRGSPPSFRKEVRCTFDASPIYSRNSFREMRTKNNKAGESERSYVDTLASIKAWVPLVPGMTLK